MTGACDCHVHVFDPRFPYAADARLRPPPATAEDMARLHARLGIGRVVVVQPTSYGTDNRCTLAAVATRGLGQARAVVVVAPDTTEADLATLHAQGARGLRLNLARAARPDLAAWTRLLQRAAPLGWHLLLHCRWPEFVELAPWVAALPMPVVLDHFARLGPAIATPASLAGPALAPLRRGLAAGRLWVKLSAPYLESRTGASDPVDMDPWARQLLAEAPGRLLWGSDWPHPAATAGEIPMPDAARLLAGLLRCCDSPAQVAQVLRDNPAALYGFEAT
ncbi:amidohydrolase family protein [Piscinibacter sakaiensis]|uniref:Putative 2-pyrone-4,6-dicarboxylic acid hydrolase n=2 Tax=Piscinibacter sakaiensis TaxID=1547922 RepID=A0A0K8NVM8_PISS1|nr:amidohydrolase family protein [Piscinibacter sakaiensis]GAP34433.1 putative 2-pyrone-4,6-dicarboxylic acid hydrolase [Piscinibacter sakaiensis]